MAFGTTNPPAIVSVNQTSTTYQPVALAAGTKYYWQIVAKGVAGSTTGPVWSLTTAAAGRPAMPVASYAFNEKAGTTAADASGNGRTGALTNATWTAAGKYGGALSFNGSSSRVRVADAAPLHLSSAMTLEAWVKPSGTGAASWQALIYKGVDNYFLALPDRTTAPIGGGTIGGNPMLATSSSALPAQTWTHVAVTYDGSMIRVFVNGTQMANQPASGPLAASTSPLEIGGSLVDAGPFAGVIDDVRVYNVALTPAQIQTDMITPVASVSDTQSPTAPMALAVTAVSTTGLTLTWTASTDAVGVTGYRIERCAGAGCTTFSQVGTVSTTSYSDVGLVASTRYTYRVRATDAAENLSSYSSSASATTLVPPAAPTAPAGPAPANAATGVSLTPTLSWAASTRATHYTVAFGTTNPPAVVSTSQTATTYQPGALTASKKYYWRIVAIGAGGSTSGPVWSLTTAAGAVRPAPIAAYAFNEGAGTTTADASGNGRTGALTNATWTAAGKFGGALSFNGSSSRVTVADAAPLHLSTAMTLEAWVRPSGTGAASWQALIYKGVDNYLLAMPDYTTAPIAGGTLGGGLALVTSPSAIPAQTWTHVAVTYDGAMVRLFVNATQVASRPANGLIAVSGSPLEIGGSLVDGGPFAGLIDDVRVYNTALTAAQIQADLTTPIANAAPAAAAAPASLMASAAPSVVPTSAGIRAASVDEGLDVGAGSTTTPASPDATNDAASAASVRPLRLMTWNVNGGHNQAGAFDVEAQVALIAGSGAQVIALQGVTISTVADLSTLYQWQLEAATGGTWNALWIPAPPQLAPATQDGNLLLTTLPITGSATTAFDSAPFTATGRDGERSAGWIAVVVNQVTVHIATMQLSADATQRDAQLVQLDGWLATVPTPRLIGGDFQMRPADTTYHQMASGFRDAWTAIGRSGDPGLTQTLSPAQSGRFDYWWSELTGERAAPTAIWVVETSRSSHHALVIDVTVQ